MIICFSGTGNTRMVAEAIHQATDEDIVMFAPGFFKHPEFIKLTVRDNLSRVIWMAPAYAWALPKFCANILNHAQLQSDTHLKHHLILTCGDDMGYAERMWRKNVEKRGWEVGSIFSVQMPNTFVGLKGFDVDPEEVAAAKLRAAEDRIDYIIDYLASDREPVTDVVRGSWPKIKTFVLNPLFYSVLMSYKRFHTNDACTGCGKCVRNCPMANITMSGGRPKFGNECVFCFRCYHICPHNALQYGNATALKGQYICPGQTFTP